MYAQRDLSAGCSCDLLGVLHGPAASGCLVVILLARHGLPATTIAGPLDCDPATIRR